MPKKPKEPKKSAKPEAKNGQKEAAGAPGKKAAEKPAETPPKKSSIVERPTVERLAVDLSPEEINNYARESARLHGDIEKTKKESKDKAAEFKAKIGSMDTRVQELNRKIESGKEDREVACVWRIDYSEGKKTLFRKPAGDKADMIEIRSYPLSPEERQMQLPIKETKADRVVKPAEPQAATPPAEAAKDNVLPFDAQDHAVDPAAEPEEERLVRIWANGLDKEHRKAAFGITEENEATVGMLTLPYRRMSHADRELIRGHYRALAKEQKGEK